MDDRVASILDAEFPDRDVAGTADGDPVFNDRNGTFCVEFADGERVYCKIAVDDDATRIARERAVIQFVDEHCDVPVPRVLASDPDAAVPYLVTEPMAGRKLADVTYDADRAGERSAMRALGRTLASVHARRFDSHGEITGWDEDGLDVDPSSWTTMFVEQVRGIREFGGDERFERYVDDVIAAIEANRETLDAAPPALVHNDPNGANCHYTESGVGLLDWEFAHVGDPARDLHRTLEQNYGLFRPDDPDHEVAGLHEGYRERAGSLPGGFAERVPIYEAVRLLSAAAFFDSNVESCEDSRAEVAEWMDAEMERRLEAIR